MSSFNDLKLPGLYQPRQASIEDMLSDKSLPDDNLLDVENLAKEEDPPVYEESNFWSDDFEDDYLEY